MAHRIGKQIDEDLHRPRGSPAAEQRLIGANQFDRDRSLVCARLNQLDRLGRRLGHVDLSAGPRRFLLGHRVDHRQQCRPAAAISPA